MNLLCWCRALETLLRFVEVSLRLLLVQVINQCCEESAGPRLAAAALLVTCRGWGSELRVRCWPFRTTAIVAVSLEEFTESSERKGKDAAKRMLWKKGLLEIHSISPSPRRLLINIIKLNIMIELQNPFGNAASFAVCAGVDWGHTNNCFHLFASDSKQVERIEVAADPASMGQFVRDLRKRFPRGKIAMVSEQTKGALVNLLLDYPFIELMAVNPLAAARFRRSLHPSGSKSDPIDSSALLRMIFTHRDRMPVLIRGDEASRRLDAINHHRRSVVDQRVEVSNRLNDLLKQYYPQALAMLGPERWDPISLTFLRKWPSYSRLMKSKEETLKRFFYTHGSRSQAAIEKRLDSRRVSAALSSDPLIEELGELQMLNYVEQLSVLNKQIRELDKRLKSAFSQHPDKELFGSLPGAGPAMAPRLAAAFGCDRNRFKSCSQMQAYVGIAPIKLQSGDTEYTFMRRFCPKFLRQSFHEWAGLSAQYSPWAKACYQMFRDRGKRVGEAKRALAFKWMRILFYCWKNNQSYDEITYVKNLIKRNSPVVGKMKELGYIDDENNILFA